MRALDSRWRCGGTHGMRAGDPSATRMKRGGCADDYGKQGALVVSSALHRAIGMRWYSGAWVQLVSVWCAKCYELRDGQLRRLHARTASGAHGAHGTVGGAEGHQSAYRRTADRWCWKAQTHLGITALRCRGARAQDLRRGRKRPAAARRRASTAGGRIRKTLGGAPGRLRAAWGLGSASGVLDLSYASFLHSWRLDLAASLPPLPLARSGSGLSPTRRFSFRLLSQHACIKFEYRGGRTGAGKS